MKNHLAALRLFVRVARTGSFSAAARELGLSQPSASRTVAELEREIGAGLFARTTRAVTLTEAGSDYLARIEPILLALEEADHAARGGGELRGTLRIATSTTFAERQLIPRLAEFLAPHPRLKIELRLNDQRQDLVGESVDVALRFGALPDSSATARRIGHMPRLLVASPAYLAQAGAPAHPGDLTDHAIILGPGGFAGSDWTFSRRGAVVSVRVSGRLNANVNEVSTAAAAAGLGIAMTGSWGCRAELASGVLARVLPDWDLGRAEVNAIFPAGRAAKASARAFVDFVAGAMRSTDDAPS